jgi:hypothetical protein
MVAPAVVHERQWTPETSPGDPSSWTVPARYDLDDEAVADRLHAQLERLATGFSSPVAARAIRPPWL